MSEPDVSLETCLNCGGTIGRLETPYLWQDKVVCADCYSRLKRSDSDESEGVEIASSEKRRSPNADLKATCPACGQIALISPDGKRARCRSCHHVFALEPMHLHGKDENALIPLICPSCGGQLKVDPEKEQLTCDHCGTELLVRHRSSGRLTLEPVVIELRKIRDEIVASRDLNGCDNPFACPRCGNSEVQQVSLLFDAGTQQIKTSSVHVGGWGTIMDPVIATSTTQGIQQSLLARRLSPPRERTVVAPVIVSLIIGFLLFGLAVAQGGPNSNDTLLFVLFLLPLVPGGFLALRNGQWNATELVRLRKVWASQCLCMRCGNIFVPPNEPI